MRKCDYFSYKRQGNLLYTLPFMLYRFRYHRLSVKLGFSMPYNVFGKGLSIVHYGTIVINGKATFGENSAHPMLSDLLFSD